MDILKFIITDYRQNEDYATLERLILNINLLECQNCEGKLKTAYAIRKYLTEVCNELSLTTALLHLQTFQITRASV